MNRLAAKGYYQFNGRTRNQGYLREDSKIHINELSRGLRGSPNLDDKAILLYSQPEIIEHLRAALFSFDGVNFTAEHLQDKEYAETSQIQVFSNYFNVSIAVWSLGDEASCTGSGHCESLTSFGKEPCDNKPGCTWKPDAFNGMWTLFIPSKSKEAKKVYNIGEETFIEGESDRDFDNKLKSSKNIIYLYHTNGNHFALIEPDL